MALNYVLCLYNAHQMCLYRSYVTLSSPLHIKNTLIELLQHAEVQPYLMQPVLVTFKEASASFPGLGGPGDEIFTTEENRKKLLAFGLSKQEQKIMVLCFGGLIRKQVADKACISVSTVNKHIESSYLKLQVNSLLMARCKMLRIVAACYAVLEMLQPLWYGLPDVAV